MPRDLDWMADAACANMPLFTKLPWLEQLKLCNVCEVRAECLEFGLGLVDPGRVKRQGIVYGGVPPQELHQLLKQRSKAAAACESPARLQVTARLPHVRERREQLVETITELLEARETPEAIAVRLGSTTEAIGRALDRAGVAGLKHLFESAARRKQPVCDADARRVVAS